MINKRLGALFICFCIAVTSFVIYSKYNTNGSTAEGSQVEIEEDSMDDQAMDAVIEKKLVMTAQYDEATQGKNTYVDIDYVSLKSDVAAASIVVGSTDAKEELPSSTEVSRGNVVRTTYGEYLDWWKEVRKLIDKGAVITVLDLDTQRTFKVKYTYGSNHIDSEPLTAEDSKIIKEIWNGYNWDRRAVEVTYNGRTIAASMVSYPHAGLDHEEANKYVSNRSGGYGSGTNLDEVKQNDVDGVMCIHFRNSTTHKNNRVDANHQTQVKRAAGIIK